MLINLRALHLIVFLKINFFFQVDNDLVFDAFETSNIDDNHPRIRRETSEVVDKNFSPSLEEEEGEYWLSNTVSRIKRSIKNIFFKDEHKTRKRVAKHHHKKATELHPKKLIKSKRAAHHQQTKIRKHRQLGQEEYEQQEEQDQYEDEVSYHFRVFIYNFSLSYTGKRQHKFILFIKIKQISTNICNFY